MIAENTNGLLFKSKRDRKIINGKKIFHQIQDIDVKIAILVAKFIYRVFCWFLIKNLKLI